MFKYIAVAATVATLTLLSGCSDSVTPTMELVHEAGIQSTYNNMGTIQVNSFTDRRPSSQEQSHPVDGGLPFANRTIYSGDTIPSASQYLHSVITSEINRTGIFTLTHPARYTMTGYISNLKVSYHAEAFNLPVTLNGNKTPVTLGGYPSYTAKVSYYVEIYQGSHVVFQQNIEKTLTIKEYGDQDHLSPQDISGQAEAILDQAVTESVNQLFTAIQARGL